jgi:hypothetical protein
MEDLKFYLRLNETAMEICQSWIGKELLSMTASQMQKGIATAEMYVASDLGIILHPGNKPVRLWQEEIELEGVPVSFALRIDYESPSHRPVVFQFDNFIIRKIEIWAEKTRDSSGLRDTTQLTENTLVFTAQSGHRWLLLPDHPGPGFVVAWGEKEINRFLHSGCYVLKHIMD